MRRIHLAAAACVFALVACGGKAEDSSDPVISDTQGLASPDPTSGGGASTNDGEDDKADEGCRDGDRDGHKNHHKHWFRFLDALDGDRDGRITIASLPDALPDRLVARLHRIDADGDGVVTRDEANAARRHRARHHEGDRERGDD